MSEGSTAFKADPNWVTGTILQIVVAGISFLASLIVVLSITLRRDKNVSREMSGLRKNAYRRIIFGISIADMLLSFSLSAGVVLFTPNDAPQFARWGIGNEKTCAFNGILLNSGLQLSPMYIGFLCFYLYCKTKHKMPDEVFKQRFEIKIHIFIFAVVTTFNIAAISLNAFNLIESGTLCSFASKPTGCTISPKYFGECDPDIEKATGNLILVSFGILGSSFLVIVFFMTGLLCHVWSLNRIYRTISTRIGSNQRSEPSPLPNLRDLNSNDNSLEETNVQDAPNGALVGRSADESSHLPNLRDLNSNDNSLEENNVQDAPNGALVGRSADEIAENAEKLRKLYVRVSITQAILFVGAYVVCNFTYFYFAIANTIQRNPSYFSHPLLRYFQTISFSGVGIVNILVFTRPAISNLRRLKPDYSWFYCFYLVLLNGGEVPVLENVILPHAAFAELNSVPFGIENEASLGMSIIGDYRGSYEQLSENNAAYNPEENWGYVRGVRLVPPSGALRRVQSNSRNNESLLVGSLDSFPIESQFDCDEDMTFEHIY
ncbi:hypothetical protein CTEN210_06218 [Chaetoceros tenuissimus]|uniref:Uncharacterized protein n=1 Tax=Chaetoceros tenuissimus TaxID=426638 RepID=A0AAD3H3Z0_9STRA|nr:hypothetical protein CTEN210_06218 [Chaetoceros tenuissimus]